MAGREDIDPLVAAIMAKKLGFPESNDYNMTGFMQQYLQGGTGATINLNDGLPHFPDTYKLPNHPTFSSESQLGRFSEAPSWSGGSLPGGGESWSLRHPSGELGASEAPWNSEGIRLSPKREDQLGIIIEKLLQRK